MLKRDLQFPESKLKHSERCFITADKLNLYCNSWLPDGKPIAVINFIHGLGEHSGRYSAWAEYFVENNIAVRSFDLRGHGKSDGKRGTSKSYKILLRDIEQFLKIGSEEFPGIPAFIYGHSLGGNLALNYLIEFIPDLEGAIITSPWLKLTNPPSEFAVNFSSFAKKILPDLTVSNRIKPEDLSREIRVVHEYKSDTLVHNEISLRMFSQVSNAGLNALRSIFKINIPLLIIHGTNDNITSHKTSQEFVRNSSDLTTYIEWEGGYHELHNDLDRLEIFNEIMIWLNKRIKKLK